VTGSLFCAGVIGGATAGYRAVVVAASVFAGAWTACLGRPADWNGGAIAERVFSGAPAACSAAAWRGAVVDACFGVAAA